MTRPKVDPDKRQRTACACDSCKRRKQKVTSPLFLVLDLGGTHVDIVCVVSRPVNCREPVWVEKYGRTLLMWLVLSLRSWPYIDRCWEIDIL